MHMSVAESLPLSVTSFDRNQLTDQSESTQDGAVKTGSTAVSFCGMLSNSPNMQRTFDIVKRIAATNTTVLVLGESGTGKELIAQAVHTLSGRKGKLVPVNCGAIPEDILESELFGHEKGAFTGAIASRIGRFQMADGGTIFLDEIGEMSPKLQVKLLRVLQERKVEPVGSTRTLDIDVRVIAATNKDLREEVKAGRFREDLFYRLQVVPIELSPLRDRGNDVLVLAQHFAQKFGAQIGAEKIEFSPAVKASLLSYRWPGNVRELENMVERMVILSDGKEIVESDLPEYLNQSVPLTELNIVSSIHEMPTDGLDFNILVDNFESKLITMALAKTKGNKKAAARLLNLNRTTLVEKIKKKRLTASIEIIREGADD